VLNLNTMEKIDLKGMDKSELEQFVKSIELETFRGRQIFRWIYQEGLTDFSRMSDISKSVREKLESEALISTIICKRHAKSNDGSMKLLFNLHDGLYVESVLIFEKSRTTLCISCQVGCPANCGFCATGKLGLKRNLSAGEIVDQFLVAQEMTRRRISNIVFMGMGEPMLNLYNVLKACRILNDDHGPSLSQKKITISTVGIVKHMRDFIAAANKLGLAISLHSADENIRQQIIPLAKQNRLVDIMAEAKRYTQVCGRRVSFEYLLIGGLNDSIEDAKKLVKLIYGIPCKINLMRYNPIDGLPYKRPIEDDVIKFRDFLYPRVYAVNIRESRGADIKGACGQLAAEIS
jgi:23S rRNA (adenine2503-C2)-methyltransferase